MHPAYDKLLAISTAVGWPEIYKDDLLVHDKVALTDLPTDICFAWALRDTGTHLIVCEDDFASDWADAINHYEKRHRWFWWDGKTLVEREFKQIDDLIDAAVARLPQWKMPYRGGEVHCRAMNLECAGFRLKSRLEKTVSYWLHGTAGGIQSVPA